MAFFKGLFRALDVSRRVLVNLVFLLIVLFIVIALVGGDRPVRIEQGIAVVVDPFGVVVEEFDADPVTRSINRLLDADIPQVRLRDLRSAIRLAAEDDRVDTLVLDLSGLAPSGLSKMEELAEAVQHARSQGKYIIAYADMWSQSTYLLAAHAHEIHVNPMGMVWIEGFSTWRTYMRDALEKLSVDWHVFKTGDYKSFGEPYERDDMSPEVRAEATEWLGALWTLYRESVEAARGMDAGSVDGYVAGFVSGVREYRGDFARYALSRGFVDMVSDRNSFHDRVAARVGVDPNGYAFRGMGWESYLGARRKARAEILSKRDRIGLVIARGAIVEGDPGQGVIGSTRMVGLIGEAADDPRIKALVVRIDSGGGSAFASEEILLALQRFRETGKPVVISMSSVAASGGYWISLAANEVWAAPSTITGSIGVVGMFPTVPRLMERLGLRTDGIGTTPLAGLLRLDRPLGEEGAALVQATVEGVYADFIERVSVARDMESAAVEALAGGRVWTGMDAQRLGLVDELGGLDDAIRAAAHLAELDSWAVSVLERPLTFTERLVLSLLEARALEPFARAWARGTAHPFSHWMEILHQGLGVAARLSDPRHVYLDCLCEAP